MPIGSPEDMELKAKGDGSCRHWIAFAATEAGVWAQDHDGCRAEVVGENREAVRRHVMERWIRS
jgi:hypothetical protein